MKKKKINIAEADVAAVARRLKQLSPNISGSDDPAWTNPPAIKVIDCVLSLNRKYDEFVVPRLKAFMKKHPEIRNVKDLASLMASFPTPHAFMQQELNYNHEDRANTLQSVVEFVCKIAEQAPAVSEKRSLKRWALRAKPQDHQTLNIKDFGIAGFQYLLRLFSANTTKPSGKRSLKRWALRAKPQDHQTLNIKGFGIAGFQYLRMLFGANTTKPDVHIIGFLSELLNRKVSAPEALHLLEAACERLGLSVRDVDTYIWQIRARGNEKD